MDRTQSALPEFLLAIVVRCDAQSERLLGTGILVAPGVALTCAHIFDPLLGFQDEELDVSTVVVRCGGADRHPSGIRFAPCPGSVVGQERRGLQDLCWLNFEPFAGVAMPRLARTTQLQGVKINAIGYVPDFHEPCSNVFRNLEVVSAQQSEGQGWIQFGQLRVGLPRGFSGGPVMAACGDEEAVVGMLQLGGEDRATSRFIAVDPIAAFLASQGERVEVGTMSAPRRGAADAPTQHASIEVGHIVNSKNVVIKQSVKGKI